MDKDDIRFELTNIEVSALELANGNYHAGELETDLMKIAQAARELAFKLMGESK